LPYLPGSAGVDLFGLGRQLIGMPLAGNRQTGKDFMDLGLTGKRALVLASSRGLGLGIAEAIAAEGADVTDHRTRWRASASGGRGDQCTRRGHRTVRGE
jgi:hypothetical protein